jgi:hypothetical protein
MPSCNFIFELLNLPVERRLGDAHFLLARVRMRSRRGDKKAGAFVPGISQSPLK